MTEEEKAEQERQKDWVKHRIHCTLRTVFDRLVDAIRYDVNSYNQIDGINRFKAEDTTGGDPGLFVSEVVQHGDGDYVKITLMEISIEVKHREKPVFSVTPHWNEDDLECELWVDGYNEPLTFPQVSQRAIGDLMFPKHVYPQARRGG